jgi:hypothetical protein
MTGCRRQRTSPLLTATGATVALAGIGFLGTGVWARREVARALTREHIAGASSQSGVVTSAGAAREMAERIRQNTLKATGGRTYAELDAYVGPHGIPTADAEDAARDTLTGEPAENPEHALWIQSTTLQTALMHAYTAFRVSELTIGLGATFVAGGVGLAAAGRRAEG